MPFSLKLCSWSIGLLVANWIIEGDFKSKFSKAKHNVLIQLTVLFAAVHLISLLYTSDLGHGFFDLEVKLAIFILPVVIGTIPSFTNKQLTYILGSFVLACTAAVLISAIWAMADDPKVDSILVNFDHTTAGKYNALYNEKSDEWLLFSYVGLSRYLSLHPTYFSMYSLFGIIILYFIIRFNSDSKTLYKAVILILASLLFVAILLLSSRIVIITSLLFVFAAVIHYLFNTRHYFQGIIMCMSIILVLILVIYNNPVTQYRLIKEPLMKENYLSKNPDLNSISLRVLEWKASLNLIVANPIFGVGIGDVQRELDSEYKLMADVKHFVFNLNSHNQYLQTTLATGLIGLLLLLGILLYPMWISYKNKNLLHVSLVLMILFCFLTESMLQVQKGVAFFSFFHSLLFFHPLTHLNADE